MSVIFNQSGSNNTQIGSIDNPNIKAVIEALKGCKSGASALKEFCQAEWYADLAKALEDTLSKAIETMEEMPNGELYIPGTPEN